VPIYEQRGQRSYLLRGESACEDIEGASPEKQSVSAGINGITGRKEKINHKHEWNSDGEEED